MKKLLLVFLFTVVALSAQVRPPDEKLTNYVSADLVNTALNKASAAVTGSGIANQIAYWTGTTTIGSLATGTYPSLTELARLKGITSPVQTQINSKQATLVGSGTGQNIKTVNNQNLLGSGNINITAGSDTTGLWSKVNTIVQSLIMGETIIGTKATLDSMIVDFRKNNYLRLNK